MSEKLFWALVLGVIGGFAFYFGGDLYTKTASKFEKPGDSTVGAPVVGARTDGTAQVY